MSRSRHARTETPLDLHLTERAIADIQAIRDYSVERWGSKVAEQYIDEIEAALTRIRDQPNLPQSIPDFHPALRFYRVRKHLLVFDVSPRVMIVLTVLHASMDIPHRLTELEPSLAAEVVLLHERLQRPE